MKIQSINGFVGYNKPQKSTKNNRQQQFSVVNFQGTLTTRKLQKYPIEKKLSHMFSVGSYGDVIAIGKNFEEIYKGISRSISSFSEIIKRILFIQHGGISVPLAFGLDSDSDWNCINIGDKNILIASTDATEELEPDETFILEDGDVIINNKMNIPIEGFGDYTEYNDDPEDMMLITDPENFATKTYKLEEAQKQWIEQANITSLNKLKPRSQQKEDKAKKLSFKNIGGMDHVIETLKRSVLYPIKFPFAYQNTEVNRGILLHGKPGTGKTLLAESLAGESNAEFIKLCGTDFESKWVGETEEKWRKLFETAKTKQPSIIFIDEFDAIVKERGNNSNNQYSDKVVNQILSLMSDLEKSKDNVFVIATTNKPETMDSAIMRSGRFGKHIEIPAPDKTGLEAIYKIHIRNKKVDPNMDVDTLVNEFSKRQFTGADVKHVVNEAHTNSWTRFGIYEKMEQESLTPEDIEASYITKEDFDAAIQDWDKNRVSKSTKPIGFRQS